MALSNVAWGLDVGTTALKAIKLRKDGDMVIVDAFDVVEHEKYLTEPDVDKNEIIKHSLVKFLERNGIKKELVFIGVPGSSTFARFVKLPPVEPRKIPEIVKFEAIQQIPFPLDQVNWDFQTFINEESPDVEVGIFAMKKELVAQVMMNFREAKLDVQGVQMSPLAVYNAVQFDGTTGGKGAVVLDIGAEHTDLIFIDQGRVWLRTINIGGNHFTDSLAKSFKVSFSKAENLKRTAATNKYAKQIFQAMRPVFSDLAAEIQRSKGFYDSSHRESKIEKIIGMGNTFKLPNLQKYIQQEMKMEVVRLDNFKSANVDPKLAAGLSEHVLSMAAAYGLALQGLDMGAIDTNLLPIEIAKANVWRAKKPWFAGAAAAIVVGMGVWVYTAWSDNRVYGVEDTQVSEVDPKRGQLVEANDKAKTEQGNTKKAYDGIATDAAFHKNQMQVDAFKRQKTDRTLWPLVLKDIYTLLPQAKNPPGADPKLPRGDQQLMVITQLKSEYKTGADFASWGLTPSGPGPAAAPAPAAATQPEAHGFGITIVGYTPFRAHRQGAIASPLFSPILLLGQYVQDLANAKDPNKPYEFDFPSVNGMFDAKEIKLGAAAGGGAAAPAAGAPAVFTLPWGVNGGPFWDAIVPDMLQLKRTEPTGLGGQPSATDQLGRVVGLDPDVPAEAGKPGTLEGGTSFVIHVKVVIKN